MSQHRPIVLFMHSGYFSPYVGQMTGLLLAGDPGATAVNLMHDASPTQSRLALDLLGACCRVLPADAIIVALIDLNVGGEPDALLVDEDHPPQRKAAVEGGFLFSDGSRPHCGQNWLRTPPAAIRLSGH